MFYLERNFIREHKDIILKNEFDFIELHIID